MLENLSPIGCDTNGNPLLRHEEYFWLIEQAEKVEQLQQEIEHLQDDLARWESGLNQTKEMYELQRQLQQAQVKAERYEKALEDILNVNSLLLIEACQKMRRIAKQALEGEE